MTARQRLLFIAPNFLFPADSGSKIRTTDILRGMKGKEFEIVLASPAPHNFSAEIMRYCDRFVHWPEKNRGAAFKLGRARHLMSPLPVSVAADISAAGRSVVARELAQGFDAVVVDFAHTAILAPLRIPAASVIFTHNVEAEIFHRHTEHAKGGIVRTIWQDQARKMEAFEKNVLRRFDAIVAVSDRDADFFRKRYGLDEVHVIPTGVDLTKFSFREPRPIVDRPPAIVFTGSMDWPANIDAIEYFRDAIWPLITRAIPRTRMTIIGRNPPGQLVSAVERLGLPWTFTGYVTDTGEHIQAGDLSVIPLRIGGGTRLKAYEAIALGSPVVSTAIGVEGLPLINDEHCLIADEPAQFAAGVIRLLQDDQLRRRIARSAHQFVAENFSSERVADRFIEICKGAVRSRATKPALPHLRTS